MLESVIKGYGANEYRDPKLKRDSQSIGENVGSAIYLYFKPLTDLYKFIKSYKTKK